jgi:superfamily II DNA or RNA helicase
MENTDSSARATHTITPLERMQRENDWRLLVPSDKNGRAWGRWNHQYKGYAFAARYLKKTGTSVSPKAAVIRMPTGSGKTGIMALIANYCLKNDNLLIVVPSAYLTGQVCQMLTVGFWQTIQKRPNIGPKAAEAFVPTALQGALDKAIEPTVFVCTTTTLADIHSDHRWSMLFEELKRRISTVIVDEGHREPAKTWAKAIRDLSKATILFSATPYRNDLRMFRIGRGRDHRFSIRFPNAVKEGVIRDVAFREPRESFVTTERATGVTRRNARTFVDELLNYYYGELQQEKPANNEIPRVIVRCNDVDSIRSVLRELIRSETLRHGESIARERVLAVHEDFHSTSDRCCFEDVPKRDSKPTRAIFWVHQFKLTEGIDNADFCVVAFYQPFANSRSLVQQIGRVLRNPGGGKGRRAVVFSDRADHLEKDWSGYLQFEASPQDVIGAEDIVYAIQEAQPKWFYAGGKYRRGVNFAKDDIWSDLRVLASARLYKRPPDFTDKDLRVLGQNVSEMLEESDLVEVRILERKYNGGAYSIAIVHWEIVQTERVRDGGFFDVRLLVTLLHMNAQHIFYQGRVNLGAIPGSGSLELLEIERLEHLIPMGEATLKQLSLVNCDLGDTAVRRRALGGRALDASAAALNDHLHFISSVVCRDGDQPRYIGLRQSRVTDRSLRLLSLDEFTEWAAELSARVSRKWAKKHAILRRYARPIRPPANALARHLLLDLNDFRGEFGLHGGVDDPAFHEEFLAAACDVSDDGSFSCEIGKTRITGSISYSNDRFRIQSQELNEHFESIRGQRQRPSTFLSSPYVMRVVTDGGLLYSDGRFFRPSRLHGADRIHDLDLVYSVQGLERITKREKGEKGRIGRGTWQSGSLFHEIDKNENLFRQCGIDPDILVCDDLDNEVGDFVAVDTDKKKLVVLHAKVFTDQGSLSAKAMHEVVAQAKKNLGFFDPAEAPPVARSEKWDRPWRTGKATLDRIRRRQHGGQDGKEIMGKIQELLHSSSVEKEVWLVLGNAFSQRKLKEIILLDEIKEWYWLQLLYLIHSCQASVVALGAQLKILTGADN